MVYDGGDVKITAIRVSHPPIEPAFGYRIDYKDRSISISGDSIYQDQFYAASDGVDLMLHEALSERMVQAIADRLGEIGDVSNQTIFLDILDYHADPEDAAKGPKQRAPSIWSFIT